MQFVHSATVKQYHPCNPLKSIQFRKNWCIWVFLPKWIRTPFKKCHVDRFVFVCLFVFCKFLQKAKSRWSTVHPLPHRCGLQANSAAPRSANQYAVLAVWASAKSCREMEMSFPMKLVSRHTKQKVLENLLLHGCVEAGGDKTQRSNTSW